MVQVFEYLYENDPDLSVRQMAWQAINQQGPSVPAPALRPARSQPRPAAVRTSALSAELADLDLFTRPLFLVNPANQKIVARLTRAAPRPRSGRLILLLVGLLLLATGLLLGWVLPGWIEWYRLEQDGARTLGYTLGLDVRASGDATHYYVTYSFSTDRGNPGAPIYTGEQRVRERIFRALATDTPIEVVFVRGDPMISRLTHANPADMQRNRFTLAAAGLLALTLLLLLLRAVQTRRASRSAGKQILWGRALACTGRMDEDGDFYLKLRYSFRTPAGETITGQLSQIRNDLKRTRLPEPGTPLAIYYRSNASYRVL